MEFQIFQCEAFVFMVIRLKRSDDEMVAFLLHLAGILLSGDSP